MSVNSTAPRFVTSILSSSRPPSIALPYLLALIVCSISSILSPPSTRITSSSTPPIMTSSPSISPVSIQKPMRIATLHNSLSPLSILITSSLIHYISFSQNSISIHDHSIITIFISLITLNLMSMVCLNSISFIAYSIFEEDS